MLTHLIVALPAEAKPLIAHFGLTRCMEENAFAAYANCDLCLTVTGIGKAAAAAGVVYAHMLWGKRQDSVWLNVGAAGHATSEVGRGFIAHKIVDVDCDRCWYPPITFAPPCATADLWTVSRPVSTYPNPGLSDMEAAGFYETATRFSTGELAQCFKIVSDNPSSPVETIDARRVSGWIEQQLTVIESLIGQLQNLARQLQVREPVLYGPCLERWRFSAQERKQLRRLLQRWEALASDAVFLPFDEAGAKTGKEVLIWLQAQVDRLPARLTAG
jgi:adenosylhomocysteine nucleosidase